MGLEPPTYTPAAGWYTTRPLFVVPQKFSPLLEAESATEKTPKLCVSVCLPACPTDCLTDWLTVSLSSRCTAEGNRIWPNKCVPNYATVFEGPKQQQASSSGEGKAASIEKPEKKKLQHQWTFCFPGFSWVHTMTP